MSRGLHYFRSESRESIKSGDCFAILRPHMTVPGAAEGRGQAVLVGPYFSFFTRGYTGERRVWDDTSLRGILYLATPERGC